MKALIWCACMLIPALPLTLAKDYGIIVGGIPTAILYGIGIWLANKLCNKLDLKKAMKKVAETGMTVEEYAKQGLSDDFLNQLPMLVYEQMKIKLKEKESSGIITHEQYILLLRLYSWTPGKDTYPRNNQ